jgi:aerobic carbon-monoxide dehydrogenase large subunit
MAGGQSLIPLLTMRLAQPAVLVDLGRVPELERSSGYADLRREQERARANGRLFGIGIGFFNEHSGTGSTNHTSRGANSVLGFDAARVRVGEDNRLEIFTSAAEAGQGHAETYRRMAAELSIEPDRVDVVEGDTRECPPGSGTFASRGAVGVGEAVALALREAVEMDLAPGTDVVKTSDSAQVFPSGAHLAVVEVDVVTLVPRVTRYVAVEDCGRVIEPLAVEGQVRGGVAMGIGDVLMEEHVYGADGHILTATLLDYVVPLAPDVPRVEMKHLESRSPHTWGSKGVGEAGVIGAYAAVANAVADAVRLLDAELTDLPYSPVRIIEAVEAGLSHRRGAPR